MSDSPPLVPTEVATSTSGYTTPDTQELIPAMDGTSNTMALMPPMIGGQRHQVAHPGNFTPTLTRQLAGNHATPVHTGPSLTYSPVQYNQTRNVAVDARAISLEATEVRQEAERRHQQAIQQVEAATSMQVHSSEQRAQQRHEEIVADMESQIANVEFQAFAKDQKLLTKLSEYQARLSQESAIVGSCRTELTAVNNTYARELDMKTRMAVDQLTEEFEASFQVYEQNQQMRFANTEEEMPSQNCELQDELAAAERALEMERNRMPTVISPPQGVAEPRQPAPIDPPTSARFEPPPAARRLFEMMNPASAPTKPIPTTAPAYSPFDGLGAYAPPGLGPSLAPTPAALRGTPGAAPEANATPLQQAANEVFEAAKLLKGDKGAEEEKPKVKEAESIKLPDFPNPETYRSWKIATREAVRAASDRPDEEFDWILAVYDRHAGHSSLRDPGKFVTLDTKLLAALTKVAKGELARQILNFKETEAGERRAVRGRQVLYLLDQHFKTNEEVGSLYSVEDLLKVNLLQDDLSTFIHTWESVVAGMSHVPDERTLRDILLRQRRRSARMKWDLDLYDRAKEGTSTHSYSFLIQSIRDLLTRERVRRNRDRIAKSHGDKYGAPAPRKEGARPQSGGRGRTPSRDSNASFRSRSSSKGPQGRPASPKAVCYDFLKGKCTRGASCKFLHKNRSPSPKPPDKTRKINKVCMYWKKGKCTRGDKCRFLHKSDKDRTPSPSRPAGTENAAPAAPEKPRCPSPAPMRRPGRGRSKSPRATPAACCVSDAGRAFQGKSSASKVKKKVLFVSRPEVKSILVDGRGGKLVNRPRRYSTCYADQENCPKADSRYTRYAIETARLLEQAVKAMLQGIPSPCDYECPSNEHEDFNVTCQHCEEVSKTACIGALAGIQFLANTGSEEDLISKHDHQAFFADIQVQNASKPVSLITANGPVQGDKSVSFKISEFSNVLECYLLESTPPVCSVGRRCMDEGHGFHWYPGQAPYFVTPEGRKPRCKMKGRVPVIGDEVMATPAAGDAKVATIPCSVVLLKRPLGSRSRVFSN